MFRLRSDLILPAEVLADASTYKSIVKTLHDHIKLGKLPQLSRNEFINLVQLPDESVADFVAPDLSILQGIAVVVIMNAHRD